MAVSDLPASREASAWRQQLRAFWRWWSGELLQLVPERLSALHGATRLPMVTLEGDDLVLVEPRGAVGPQSRVSLATLDEDTRRAATRALLEHAGEARGRVRLRLARGEALVRRVTMPAATEENLRQVLEFEMDRLTPFRSQDVYFDYQVVGRDAAAAQIAVRVAVALRDLVDRRLDRLRALSVQVQAISVPEDDTHAGPALDLLPGEQRGERRTGSERLLRQVMVAAVAILALAALLVPPYLKREAIITLLPVVAQARQQAEAADVIARDLERQVNDYNFLLTKKHATYPVLAYIEDLSRLLGDATWLQQMEVKTVGKTREVVITGETPSSSKLIEVLEQSKLLRNATPRGTVTRGSSPNTERFMIAAEAPPRPLPEPVPVIERPATAPAAAAPAQQPPARPAPSAGAAPSAPAKPGGK